MKQLMFILLVSAVSAAAQSKVDIFSAKDMQANREKLAQKRSSVREREPDAIRKSLHNARVPRGHWIV